jgi:hypothetical protein
MSQVCGRGQHLLRRCEGCLHLSGPLQQVRSLPVASQGVCKGLKGAGHRWKKTAVEVEETQEPLQLLYSVGAGKFSHAKTNVGRGVTVTLWPKKSMEGAQKNTFPCIDDQAMLLKMMLNVIFAGHLQIVLLGKEELQLVFHLVNLPLEVVAGISQAKGHAGIRYTQTAQRCGDGVGRLERRKRLGPIDQILKFQQKIFQPDSERNVLVSVSWVR